MYLYILLFIAAILCLWSFQSWKHSLHVIPGPSGVPIFGNIFQLDFKNAHIRFYTWAKEYGNVFKLNLAGKPVVIVSGISSLHEMFITKGKDFAGRPNQTFRISQDPIIKNEVAFRNPEGNWHYCKKLMLKYIHGYGHGFNNIETLVNEAIENMIDELNACTMDGSEPVDFAQCLVDKLWSITYSLIFGMQITQIELDTLNDMSIRGSQIFAAGGFGELLDLMPWLRHFGHPLWPAMQNHMSKAKQLRNIWKDRIQTDQYAEKSQEANFCKILLDKIGGENPKSISEDQAMAMCFEMMVAGTITSSATLRMLFNVFAHNPEIQNELHSESQRVLAGRDASYRDYKHMHYHHATILEALRYGTVIPLALPHETTRDTTLSGFPIPKGTLVLGNLWGLSHEEDFWGDPWEFLPERFLDEAGEILSPDHVKRVHLMPFGAGPRVCPGATFAKTRMFLILARVVQKFKIFPATSKAAQPSCDCRDMENGIVLNPLEYKVRLMKRTGVNEVM